MQLCSQNAAAVSVHQNHNNDHNITISHHSNNAVGCSSSSTTPVTPNPLSSANSIAQHEDHINILENKRNLWLSTNNFLTADAIAMASMQEKAYLSQFPSPTMPSSVTAAHDKQLYSSSCRYPQEKMDFFSKYANIQTETAAAAGSGPTRHSSTAAVVTNSAAASITSPYLNAEHQSGGVSSVAAAAAAASMYGGHFSPIGYHLPLPTYESATAARTCALPSPTIYPPTPPPSAPWIHPWFIGDTF